MRDIVKIDLEQIEKVRNLYEFIKSNFKYGSQCKTFLNGNLIEIDEMVEVLGDVLRYLEVETLIR